MKRWMCVLAGILTLVLAPAARSQTEPPAAAQAVPWKAGPIHLSGIVDAYYSLNFNHPASRINQLRNFDVRANQFGFSMAKLTLDHVAEPVGFRVDLGVGRTLDVVHAGETQPGRLHNLPQAYVSWKPSRAKGLQLDFGKFVTSAGAEVIEPTSNWNYSRSLVFAWAIPYYHFGLRSSMPLHRNFTAGLQLVNGWNNIEDNNSGKTIGLTGTVNTTKAAWSHSYYFGPEKTGTNHGYRHLYDTTLLLTPNTRASLYVNFDYGMDRLAARGSRRWVGIAGAARFPISKWFALTPRLEWFNDADGFSTGTAQKLKEVTLTAEFAVRQGLWLKPEYRRDWSNTPFFDRGGTLGAHKNLDTLLVGVVAYFGPKR